MAIKRKASNAALEQSLTKRVTRSTASQNTDPVAGAKIVVPRQRETHPVTPRKATPRKTYANKQRSLAAEKSTRKSPRFNEDESSGDDELLMPPCTPKSPPPAPATPSRTRSGKTRAVRIFDTKLAPSSSVEHSDSEDDTADMLPIPFPPTRSRSTRSSPVKPSPIKPILRKTSSPAKKRVTKARTPTPVSDSEDEVPETSPIPSSSRQASLSPELPDTTEESNSIPSPALEPPNHHSSPVRQPAAFSQQCLNAQKREILRAIQNPPNLSCDEDEETTNSIALSQLGDLLRGTVARGEGNSCILLGPRGSGKTRILNQCLAELEEQPIVLRLCGWSQQTDRLAMREIAYQLSQQTGKSFLSATDSDEPTGMEETDEEANPFLETPNPVTMSLPPSTHLPALISLLPTLSRPTIIILDAFDLFAQHSRQSLLYCLLDTAQSCRAGAGSKGIAVIGMTTRVDTVTLLEKRVKSRFSGRTFRTAPPSQSQDWVKLTRSILSCKIPDQSDLEETKAWHQQWNTGVQSFVQDEATLVILKETFSITKDVRVLARLLTSVLVQLTPSSPYPTSSQLISAATLQRSRPQFSTLHALPYPALCLLIACVHTETAGHSTFTFEMLYERVRDQIRFSASAPVQINGISIGMPQCPRSVLMSAFESLVSANLVAPSVAHSVGVNKEFVKYRAVVGREDVKKAIQTRNDINLTKWLTKSKAS
ncbi:AAA domain-containing protein [Favolaschia claudopus]|uniref:AAA domain-containing protein n=1 Tax=Favolaschia claudopus TaxID=2862362 RepID=A0AAW0EE41_9AGAR